MEGGGKGDVTDDTGGSRQTIILLGCVGSPVPRPFVSGSNGRLQPGLGLG